MGCRIKQAYNPQNSAWVKYKFGKHGFEAIDVKQREPQIPFKNVPITKKK